MRVCPEYGIHRRLQLEDAIIPVSHMGSSQNRSILNPEDLTLKTRNPQPSAHLWRLPRFEGSQGRGKYRSWPKGVGFDGSRAEDRLLGI